MIKTDITPNDLGEFQKLLVWKKNSEKLKEIPRERRSINKNENSNCVLRV